MIKIEDISLRNSKNIVNNLKSEQKLSVETKVKNLYKFGIYTCGSIQDKHVFSLEYLKKCIFLVMSVFNLRTLDFMHATNVGP